MKGQLVFEFVIAALILFFVVIYTINYVSDSMNLYHASFVSNYFESRSIQVSDVLLNDPVNGIVREWPLLSMGKMSGLENLCDNDYYLVLERFDLDRKASYDRPLHLYVSVDSINGTNYMVCGSVPPPRTEKATTTRFGLLPSSDIARVEVTIW